jgi:hypothetical protein
MVLSAERSPNFCRPERRRGERKGVTRFVKLRAGERVENDVGTDELRGTPQAKNVRGTPQPEPGGSVETRER